MNSVKVLRAALACSAMLVAAVPAGARDISHDDVSPHTSESGAPLTAVEQAMALPHLALAIDVFPDSKTIKGLAEYTVQAAAPLSTVEFDLDHRFKITDITVDGASLGKDAWSNDEGLLHIALPTPLATGSSIQLGITYSGAPRVAPNAPWNGGFVWSSTPDGKPWIATAVQSEGCDLFWPCVDHPSRRVDVLDLSVSVPEGLVVASNGRLIGSETVGKRTTWRWQARKPNGYGVSLQIGPYELAQADYASRFGNSIPISFWYLPGNKAGADRLVAEMKDYLDFFESTVGPYPWGDEKVGLAETPHLGMEHQTINAYGENYKLAPEGFDWLMAHEFAHEWFANQLSNAGTADMWLQEGFGTYMQPLFLKWKQGEASYISKMWEDRPKIRSRVPLAPRGFVQSNYYDDEEAAWGGDIYTKGSWVMHTLRYLVGDKAFFAAVTNLVYNRDDPRPGNFDIVVASTDDFQRIAEEKSGRDLGWFFDAYFRTAPLPRLDSARFGTTLSLEWSTPAAKPFAMPVEVNVDGKLVTVPMTAGRGEITLPSAQAHVVLDPWARILRYDPAIEAWQAQQDKARAKAAQ
ncbi:M1 family metallopeptidase [Croceibacterium salegens]|nr:M1 family metallopeptidase [Croceibacterium salegens]